MNLSLLKCLLISHLLCKAPSNPTTSFGSSFLSASLLIWFGQFPPIPFQPSFFSSYLSSLQWPLPVALQLPTPHSPTASTDKQSGELAETVVFFPIRHWTSEIKEKTTLFCLFAYSDLSVGYEGKENKEKEASDALVNSSLLCYCLHFPSGISLTEGPLLA